MTTLVTVNDSGIVTHVECTEHNEESMELIHAFSFWIEGVLCCLIAVPGFIGNIGSSYVLSSKGQSGSNTLPKPDEPFHNFGAL